MTPKLYVAAPSPPARSVLITAAAIGLELEKQDINVLKGEHLTPEFIKLNPAHTIPTLVDGDFVLWDSHAINAYLVSKYAKDDSLYPKDLQKRAIVDSRLHYNNATVFNTLKELVISILHESATVSEEGVGTVEKLYSLLNTLLEQNKFIAGSSLTIADYCLITEVSTAEVLVPIDEAKFPKLVEWANKVKELPCYASSVPGLKKFEEIVLLKLKK